MTFKSTLAAVGFAAIAATSVSAATLNDSGTISAGDIVNLNTFLQPNTSRDYTFVADGDLRILDFIRFSSLGFNDGDDLEELSFGYAGDAGSMMGTYDDFDTDGATTEAASRLPGFVLRDGQSFTLSWNYGDGTDQTTNQSNFEVAAVPVPAAGLLLLTAIAGGAVAGRRKKKA